MIVFVKFDREFREIDLALPWKIFLLDSQEFLRRLEKKLLSNCLCNIMHLTDHPAGFALSKWEGIVAAQCHTIGPNEPDQVTK